MDLILWRHADAEDVVPDGERALTKKGRKQAAAVAARMKPHIPRQAAIHASPPAGPQTLPYEGKQIRLVIASGAGGGYDVYARFLARHLPRHIPGNPTIVTQNMPAASGLAATNWAYSPAAPRDEGD